MFGSGNYLGIEVNTSRSNRTLVISTDPYFTIDGISRAFDIYYRTTNRRSTAAVSEYQLVATPGVAVRFGVPFSEYDTVFFGLGPSDRDQGHQRDPPTTSTCTGAVRRDSNSFR